MTSLFQQHAHRRGLRNPQNKTFGNTPTQIVQLETVSPFRTAPARAADQRRELAISAPVWREQYELDSFGQYEFGTDNEVNPALFSLLMRLDDTRQRTFIGNGDALVTEFCRTCYQFLRMACAVQKTEVALAVQLCKNVRRSSHERTSPRARRKKSNTDCRLHDGR